MRVSRAVGAGLLLIGAVASITRVVMVLSFAPAGGGELGVVAIVLGPALLIALGCVALGWASSGRTRLGYLVVALASVLYVGVNAAQILLGSPFGPAPSGIVGVVQIAALLCGAWLVFTDAPAHDARRWTILAPAAGTVLMFVMMALTAWPALEALPSIGWIVAAYLSVRDSSARVPALP